jgi:short-subunit dehydrogenase
VERPGHGAIIAFPDRYQQLLDGKVVIITGASEGIGASLAAALRKRGALLTLAARTESKLRAVAASDCLVVPGDLTQDSARKAVIEKTMERRGRIDVLINNAGRGSYYSGSTTPIDEARGVFELNFFAPLALAQMAIPHLRTTKGTIVNISSIAGEIPLPWLPVYSASKAALASITATQRMELRRDGINVMGVFPGYVNTDFQANAAGSPPPIRVVQGKRFAVSVEDCAAAIVKGIESRKRVVVTPGSGWPLMFLHRILPGMVESRLEAI